MPADAGYMQDAAQSDDGDAHPQAFAGRGLAVVGEGIEADVDLREEGPVVFEREGAAKEEAVGGDSSGGEGRAEVLAGEGAGVVEFGGGIV